MGEHISFVVNGIPRELDVEPRRLLVQAIREDLAGRWRVGYPEQRQHAARWRPTA